MSFPLFCKIFIMSIPPAVVLEGFSFPFKTFHINDIFVKWNVLVSDADCWYTGTNIKKRSEKESTTTRGNKVQNTYVIRLHERFAYL